MAHIKCGFGVHPSKFLERVSRHYGIEVCHLLPNAVSMLSVFSFLCEAWLGVKPYLDLWHYFYTPVYHASKLAIGSVGFSLRKAEEYIHVPTKLSWKLYERKWFYLALPEKSPIKGRALMPVVTGKWRSVPVVTEKMKKHIARI